LGAPSCTFSYFFPDIPSNPRVLGRREQRWAPVLTQAFDDVVEAGARVHRLVDLRRLDGFWKSLRGIAGWLISWKIQKYKEDLGIPPF